MGKMVPVPQIGGLEELLNLVREDNKITKYLNQMQDLRDSIVENLAAYEKHNDLDMRTRDVVNAEAAAGIATGVAQDLKEKADKSIALKRKNLQKREDKLAAGEKDLMQQKDTLREGMMKYDGRCRNLESAQEKFDDYKSITTKDLEQTAKGFAEREADLENKLATLKKLFG